ncbi:hypothetical protein [Halovivax limisalsi]|uniref:hypothetical protein n=1 Tax=Halovivax limisalsi TaxID=1453760 RepID=UPI001FFD28C5|nr:hypothetical protein [Halovivax limisalsi]
MTRPRLVPLGGRLVPGLLAVALFAFLALVVLGTDFGAMTGYDDVSITAAIGYSLFDLEGLQASRGVPDTEPFLVAFILIAVVLDAALDASIVLAKREDAGESTLPASFDASDTRATVDDAATGAGASGESAAATDGGTRPTEAGASDAAAAEGGPGGTTGGENGGDAA